VLCSTSSLSAKLFEKMWKIFKEYGLRQETVDYVLASSGSWYESRIFLPYFTLINGYVLILMCNHEMATLTYTK